MYIGIRLTPEETERVENGNVLIMSFGDGLRVIVKSDNDDAEWEDFGSNEFRQFG